MANESEEIVRLDDDPVLTDPTGEAVEEAPKKREHVGGVLGVFFGLMVFIGSVLGLMAVRGGGVHGTPRANELLGPEPRIFGLELVEAARLPTSELVLRLEVPGSAEPTGEAGAEPDEPEPEIDAEPAHPAEVVFVLFASPEAALSVFRGDRGLGEGMGGGRGRGPGGRGRGGWGDSADYGASANMLRWEKNPDFAWHTTIESNEIAWGRWTADYKVERSFREGGSWGDSVRVNLCQKGRSVVLFAQWPDETEVDKDVLRELLRAVRMLDVEEA